MILKKQSTYEQFKMSDIESTSSCVEQTLEHDGRQCDRKAISDSDSIVGTVPSGQDAVQGQNAERARNKPWAKIKRFFRSAVKRKDSSAMREMSPVNNGELTIGPSAEGSIGNGHLEQLGITLAHGQDIVQDRETERAKNKPWAKIKRFCRFTVKRKDSSDKHENSVTGENGPTVHRPAGNGEDPEHPSVEGSEKPASNGHLDVPESESKVTSLNDDEVETVAVEDRSARRSKIETWRKIQRFCRSVVKCSGDTGENPFRSVARPNSSLAGKGEEPEIMFVERLHEPATNSRLAEQKCEPENVVDKVGRDHSRSLENISAKNVNNIIIYYYYIIRFV